MRHAALLTVIGLAVYANALHAPFVFDDLHAVVENPFVRQLWPLTHAAAAPPQSATALALAPTTRGASQNHARALSIMANQASNGSDMSFLR
jgi:hypothetical protein